MGRGHVPLAAVGGQNRVLEGGMGAGRRRRQGRSKGVVGSMHAAERSHWEGSRDRWALRTWARQDRREHREAREPCCVPGHCRGSWAWGRG